MEIRNVGVAGCGLMGAGIAQVCAQAGYQTTVLEVSDTLLAQGLEKQRRLLEGAVAKGKLSQAEMQSVLARLRGTTRVEDLAECDLVIEAIREDLGDKTRLFSRLDELCPAHTIFASNTSSIHIMYEEFQDARYAPPTLLKQMVTAGYFGRKSGRGFYDYSGA